MVSAAEERLACRIIASSRCILLKYIVAYAKQTGRITLWLVQQLQICKGRVELQLLLMLLLMLEMRQQGYPSIIFIEGKIQVGEG